MEFEAIGGDGTVEDDDLPRLMVFKNLGEHLGCDPAEGGGGGISDASGFTARRRGDSDVADAEWHVPLGMSHQDGFHRVIEVGVEIDFDGGDGLRGVPGNSNDRLFMGEIGDPGIGFTSGAAGAVR